MALREMMEMKKMTPDSLNTMAAVRRGGMPPPTPQPQEMMPPAAPPQGMMPPSPSPAMAQGTGMPLAVPQPAPAMAMSPSGLAGIAPPPVMPKAPESNMVLEAVATLNKRGNPAYAKLARAAEDRGMTLPSADSGLMRLAAEGGPVLYRREGGIAEGPSREEILAQMKLLAQNAGVGYDIAYGEPLSFVNNPYFGNPDDEFDVGGGLMFERGAGPGGFRTINPGRKAFQRSYGELLGQLNDIDKPTVPTESKEFIDINDARYGSLQDPNLPSFDAAQQRNQYRLGTGFFEQPPGPTVNTNRLLTQAYGEDSPILSEIMQGLQPRRNPNDFETARLAYANLPDVQLPPEVEAKSGGGLYELAAGGEFAGRVPGDGGGMQDNVRMPIKEGNKQVATLAVSPTEYVVDSHTMAALGNGNPDKGADYMDDVVKGIRTEAYGNTKQPKEINGLSTLKSMMG